MSDQDELRNRIDRVISEVSGGQSSHQKHAQAIIDEFGLAVETHAATHSKRAMTRITGAWEWDNQ